jgi:hypothetical protein
MAQVDSPSASPENTGKKNCKTEQDRCRENLRKYPNQIDQIDQQEKSPNGRIQYG